MKRSPPLLKTSARKPSHFGSKSQLSPGGRPSLSFESIGSSGGWKGSAKGTSGAEVGVDALEHQVNLSRPIGRLRLLTEPDVRISRIRLFGWCFRTARCSEVKSISASPRGGNGSG